MRKVLNGDEPIGTIIRIQGKKYEVTECPPDGDCKDCGFHVNVRCEVMNCLAPYRKDGIEVLFVRRADLEPRKHQKIIRDTSPEVLQNFSPIF